jgi:hypothetical protein
MGDSRQMPNELNDKIGTNSTVVFDQVRRRLESDDIARSLWQKILLEVGAAGVPSAISYLSSRFVELSAQVSAAMPDKKDR